VHPTPPPTSAPRAPETSARGAPYKEIDLLREIDLKEIEEIPPPFEILEIANEREEEEGKLLVVAKSRPLKTLEQALAVKPEADRGLLAQSVRKVCSKLELAPDSAGALVSQRDDLKNIKLDPAGLIGLITLFKSKNLNGGHLEEACVLLSDYIANSAKGKKYKDHAAAIRSWVLDKVIERQNKELVVARNEQYLENAHQPKRRVQ
jgi:hypothetical protein